MTQRRPNILFLMSDEHRADVSGFAGNSVVRTPTLDFLAETGVVFENAYTPSPVCIPARQCMMAGQFPPTCDCRNFGEDLTSGYYTFARHFSRYAYKTVCSGKLHHMGRDQMQGWTVRLAPDAYVEDHFIEDAIEEEFARYRPASRIEKWTNQREIEEAKAADGPYQKFDKQAIDEALDYLDRYFKDDLYKRPQNHRPLLFKLSLLQPHYPFYTTPEWFDYYLDKVPVFRDAPNSHPVLGRSQAQPDGDVNVTEEQARRATAAYYGMISTVDSYYGNILDKLKSLGEDLEEWIIIYTSDHGDMLGEHGIWEKIKFYESSVKVPLIIRWPKRFKGSRRISHNVNLCDLYATICELTGIDTPSGLDSRSLVPLLEDNQDGWQHPDETLSWFGDNHVMIKSGNLKYMYFGEGIEDVLFDLEKDPDELVNLVNDPEYSFQLESFRSRLDKLSVKGKRS